MEEDPKQKIKLQRKQMERELKENMALMNAKMEYLKRKMGFPKKEDAMPAVEQKVMEPPSPMKVDDNSATNKLVIDQNVAEMLDSEMRDSKEVINFSTDGTAPGLYSAKSVQSMREKGWSDEKI
uniref:Uncharacterized protein n=1 Tax=Romanomermis culicivorax TaxID=13658 RepID=A0A915J9S1_ROMCU